MKFGQVIPVGLSMVLAGCASLLRDPPKGRIVEAVRYDRAECERALAEAERRLGMTYAGDGIRVQANKGTRLMQGKYFANNDGMGGVTSGGTKRQYVAVWVDPVTWRAPFEVLVHEMAHCVLMSHGISGHPPAYKHLFWYWQNEK